MTYPSLDDLEQRDDFVSRHIGPSDADVTTMLETVGLSTLDELIATAVPPNIISKEPFQLRSRINEAQTLARLRAIAADNKVFKSYIGMGYYGCYTPSVIQRHLLENPAWYTAYTPYQAEISQGRLEALLNFQTMVCDLTGMDIANASMLDEGTAAAEAMALTLAQLKKKKAGANRFWVMDDVFPQTREVLETRALPLEIELVSGSLQAGLPEGDFIGALIQYPSASGSIGEVEAFIQAAKARGVLTVVATDLLALLLLKSPGEMGADVVVGSAQRFGVPMGFGGPHAGFFATRDAYKRSMPGRIVGMSVDKTGKPALRLALQTREQHIRREKATSNICTSQVLLAAMAGMYGVFHGPRRLHRIASRTHRLTQVLAAGLARLGHQVNHAVYFDTLNLSLDDAARQALRARAESRLVNLAYHADGSISISLDETTSQEDVQELLEIFAGRELDFSLEELNAAVVENIPAHQTRSGECLTHPIFRGRHSETHMLRYLQHLVSKDLSLVHSMIPLGSCTMKLNAATEMMAVTWPEFSNLHPFAPADQVQGYARLTSELEAQLCDITGFVGVSLQPNAGSQGEYAGLLTIRNYHRANGQGHRDVCIIPSSAHGTNPASAAMAGMKVVVVDCDDQGNIDIADLAKKAEANRDNLAALMITYPSTHGVFETGITEICQIIHGNGGQVYMDGANMNALVGICRPGEFGADVCHLNLHKTFCIPHGGGGPGVGPIGVAEHLKPFLPGHRLRPDAFSASASSAVSAAPWGSASILPISWSYITMMGLRGLRRATQVAILNANYIAKRLSGHYDVLYKGNGGLVAHECIIDTRPLKAAAGVEVEDIAKRLMDYGFHAPTMSWPVAGTLMIEPTESESKEELDRFCDAMIAIRAEAAAIERGEISREDNPLKNAPHTLADITAAEWTHPYSREQAVYPLPWLRENKFWTSVNRIDNVYGDKHLVCSCPAVDSYR